MGPEAGIDGNCGWLRVGQIKVRYDLTIPSSYNRTIAWWGKEKRPRRVKIVPSHGCRIVLARRRPMGSDSERPVVSLTKGQGCRGRVSLSRCPMQLGVARTGRRSVEFCASACEVEGLTHCDTVKLLSDGDPHEASRAIAVDMLENVRLSSLTRQARAFPLVDFRARNDRTSTITSQGQELSSISSSRRVSLSTSRDLFRK